MGGRIFRRGAGTAAWLLAALGGLAAEASAQDGLPPPPAAPVFVRPAAGVVAGCPATPCRREPCRRFALEIEGGPVWQTLNDVAVPGDTGTRFALDDLTGAGPFPAGRVTFDWQIARRHGVRALVAPLEFSGTGTFDRPVTFEGRTYAPGVPTEGTYRFNSYRLTYRYTLVETRRWLVHVGLTAKVRDAKIELEQAGVSSRKTDLGVVPLLHADAEFRVAPRWRLSADLDGLGAEQGRAIDFALKLRYDLDDRWNVAIGYRTLEGGADNDDVYTFAWLHYAVVSVGVTF